MSSGRVFRFAPTPEHPAKHLFVFLHGCGATAQSMIPIAFKFQARFPSAALVVPSGFNPEARGTGPGRAPCSGHARHRRGPRPCAFASRDQPRVAAPPAGHLRGSPRDVALKDGIVLFAHGSRDPEWARPFQRIAEIVGRTAPHCVVRIAYLEIMRPSLEEAVAALAKSVKAIRVVPVFLGQGSHLKEDLPRLVAAVG